MIRTKPILCIVLIISFILYSFFYIANPTYIPMTPDESGNIFFGKHLSECGELTYHSGIETKITRNSTYIKMNPRFVAEKNSNFIPGSFLGYYYLSYPFLLVDDKFIYIMNAALGSLGLLFIYYFLKEFNVSDEISLISIIIIMVFPVYWFYSVATFSNIASAVFFIGSILYISRAYLTDTAKYYIIGSIFGALSIFVRYDYIVIFAIIIPIASLLSIKRNRIVGIVFMGIFLLTLITIMNANYFLYGSWFSMGHIESTSVNSTVSISNAGQSIQLPKMEIDIERILSNITYYFSKDFSILSAFCILGVFYSLNAKLDKSLKLKIIFIVSSMITIIFYATNLFYGYKFEGFGGEFVFIRSSYARYFLPVYLVMFLFIASFLDKIRKSNRGLTLAVIFVIFISMFLINFNFDGIYNSQQKMHEYDNFKNIAFRETSSSAIIISTHSDEKLFPERKIGLLPEFTDSNAEGVKIEIEKLSKEYDIFIVQDGEDVVKYIKYLKNSGFRFEYIKADSYGMFKLLK